MRIEFTSALQNRYSAEQRLAAVAKFLCTLSLSPTAQPYIGWPVELGLCQVHQALIKSWQSGPTSLAPLITPLAPRPWSLDPGPLVPGPWALVPGPWSLVPGPWSLVPGLLSLVPGPWSLDPGLRSLDSFPWSLSFVLVRYITVGVLGLVCPVSKGLVYPVPSTQPVHAPEPVPNTQVNNKQKQQHHRKSTEKIYF